MTEREFDCKYKSLVMRMMGIRKRIAEIRREIGRLMRPVVVMASAADAAMEWRMA